MFRDTRTCSVQETNEGVDSRAVRRSGGRKGICVVRRQLDFVYVDIFGSVCSFAKFIGKCEGIIRKCHRLGRTAGISDMVDR